MSYYESPSVSYGKSFGSGFDSTGLPKLRSDLVIRERIHKHERFYVIKDPATKAYFKFTPDEWDLFALFDGQHTEESIVQEYNEKHPFGQVDPQTVEDYKNSLKSIDLLDVSVAEKNLMLMERLKEQRKTRVEGESIFYMTLYAWDPDKQFNYIIPHVRFFWTKAFLIISVISIILGLSIDISRWAEFRHGLIVNYSFSQKTFWDFLIFLFCLVTTGMMHELAHGLTLKNFGGEVRQIGFMLFYISIAFFCDVSDSYIIPNAKHRRWVIFAGGYSELFTCSLASFVWYLSVPGTLLNDIAFQLVIFTGFSSFLLNMNPLLKLDGYFLLMDYLGIPDLREESFAYLTYWLKKRVFRLDVEEMDEPTIRKRRIYILYGISAILYTTLIYLLIITWIRNIFVKTFHGFGYFLWLLTLYMLFRNELREALGFARYFYLDKREMFMKKNMLVGSGFGAVALTFCLFTIPTHVKIESPFVIQPSQRAEVRAETAGLIEKVLVHENDYVQAGQELARLSNSDLSQQATRFDGQIELLNREMYVSQSSGDSAQFQLKLRAQKELLAERSEVARKLGKLSLKAPVDGTIVTPYVEEQVGAYMTKGKIFCTVANLQRVKLQLPVPEYHMDYVRLGQDVLLKLDAYPTETFKGQIAKISPAISERVEGLGDIYTKFAVDVLVANPDSKLLPGMKGDAEILAEKHSIGVRIGREIFRWVKFRIW